MQELYSKNKIILRSIIGLSENVKRQNNVSIIWYMQMLAKELGVLLSMVVEEQSVLAEYGLNLDLEYLFTILNQMLAAQDNEDYILYSDLAEFQMYPLLLELQNTIRLHNDFFESYWEQNMQMLKEKDSNLYQQLLDAERLQEQSVYKNDIYSVEDTNIGDYTVAVTSEDKKLYLHDNNNPVGNAHYLIDYYYDAYKNDYLIIGLGLGYHGANLAQRDTDLQITIIENDIGMIQLAMTYTDMSWYIKHEGVRIVYDAEFQEMSKILKEREEIVVVLHQPSIKRVKQERVLHPLRNLLTHEGSIRAYSDRMVKNFIYNSNHCYTDLTEVKKDFENKTVVIVAAGPSLDRNVHLLKERRENVVIFALGAVLRKLIRLQIPVDYTIITDPKEGTYVQIEGIENSEVPMFLMSTATKKIAKCYQGRKYLICQNGYPDAEQYARGHELELFETGGSVATTALDLCIRWNAKKIILVGHDLAFTGNRDHATDVHQDGTSNFDDMMMVEDVFGNMVPTCRPFAMYREWMERRITENDVTMPVIDATEGGAKIKGTDICTLEEVLRNV